MMTRMEVVLSSSSFVEKKIDKAPQCYSHIAIVFGLDFYFLPLFQKRRFPLYSIRSLDIIS